jgi:hypothetical protein
MITYNVLGLGPGNSLLYGAFGDARAMSQAELQQRAIEHARREMGTAPTLQNLASLSNWRPPVHVPAGWAEWFATGDEAV